jgi:hypothetical protein
MGQHQAYVGLGHHNPAGHRMKNEYEIEFEFKWWHIVVLAIFILGCGLAATVVDLFTKLFRKR